MGHYVLPRTGLPALTFTGDILATANSQVLAGSDNLSRWYEIAVYKSTSKRYLVHVAFRSKIEKECQTDVVEVFDLALDAVDFLWKYHGSHDSHDQHSAVRGPLRKTYEQLVTQITIQIPDFAVTV